MFDSALSRHPSLYITDEQEANLRKLAAYLMTLPEDYPDFEMSCFVSGGGGSSFSKAHTPTCGTAACAAGHGPLAGIPPQAGEDWDRYSRRAFTPFGDHGQWDWCFSAFWADIDNTVHGAAKRIQWMLDNGVPETSFEQGRGIAPLCYTDAQVQA